MPRVGTGIRTALASVALLVAVTAVGLLAAAPLGWRLGYWHYGTAFRSLLPWAAYTGVAAMALAVLCLGVSWRRPRIALAGLAALLAGALAVAPAWYWSAQRGQHPPINDISTDTADPPGFAAILAVRKAANAQSADYGGAATAEHQRRAYADIVPAHERALAAARAMGWRIGASDPGAGILEASAESRWFGFVDDVVVRVRPDAGGSRIDVRSKSREGRGDFGANARRVRLYLSRLAQSL